MIIFLFPVYTDGSQGGHSASCATVFPSGTVISMRLPDAASVFIDKVWTIVKSLEQGRKEMFYITTHTTHFIYSYMVKNHSDSERRNPLPPHGLFPISSKGSFICIIPQTG